MLNQGSYKHKISTQQREINKYMIISFALIIGLMILMSQITNRVWHSNNVKGTQNHFYLLKKMDEEFDYQMTSVNAVFTFFLLFNSFIPLNMAVINFLTMYLYSAITKSDPQFIGVERSEQKGSVQGIKIKALDLLQDLVLTNHIFCDKTGTLTKNQLIFRDMVI